jgi:predicted NBD/HSP70 family sugar kinase
MTQSDRGFTGGSVAGFSPDVGRMRKIDTARFRIATRQTSRQINRTIALNLVRARQPISRADLARAMGVRRGAVSLIVNDLLRDGAVVEGATGDAVRGRKPTFLYIDTQRRAVAAVDIRVSQTLLMLADLLGKPIGGVVTIATERDPRRMVKALAGRIRQLLADHPQIDECTGLGVAVPGMVERPSMRVLHAPTLGWRDVDLRDMLAKATKLPVELENSGRACALAQLWAMHGGGDAPAGDFVFVSVSDGLGVGISLHREVLRGRHNLAGEFGHIPFALDGPRCSCGSRGCWESYVANRATLGRYFGRDGDDIVDVEAFPITFDDLLARARGGDNKALAALSATGRYLGVGIAALVNGLDPTAVYVGGEITAAWDLVEPSLRVALAERALTTAVASTPIRPVATSEYPRLRGAAALVTAPVFAAPVVA